MPSLSFVFFLIGLIILFLMTLPFAHAQEPFDLHKLAHGVAVAETSNCTRGVGVSKHNCFALTRRGGGFRSFQTSADSYAAFEEMYPRLYGNHFPTKADAARYTDNSFTDRWLATVARVYNQ